MKIAGKDVVVERREVTPTLALAAVLTIGALSFSSSACAFGASSTNSPLSAGKQRGGVKSGSQSYLGISVRAVGDDQVASLKLRDTRGAEIIHVDHDAPAGKMGLREHDVVLQMNGANIETDEQLRRLMRDCPPGRMVVMIVAREGQMFTTSAPMADRVEIERQWVQRFGGVQSNGFVASQELANAMPAGEIQAGGPAPVPASRYSKSFLGSLLTSPTYTGVVMEVVRPQLAQFFGVTTGSGLLVSNVADNSPAAMAGLKAGDVITRANTRAMNSTSHWYKMIREAKGRPVLVEVVRDHQIRTLTLTPDVKHKSSLEMPPPAPQAMVQLAAG